MVEAGNIVRRSIFEQGLIVVEKDFALVHRGYSDGRVTNVVLFTDGYFRGTCLPLRMPTEFNDELIEEFSERPMTEWGQLGNEWEKTYPAQFTPSGHFESDGSFFTRDPVAIELAGQFFREVSKANNHYWWDFGLRPACTSWQSGRDGGSTPIRGGARILTGVPHYFEADFINEIDDQARQDQETLTHARTLLRAVGLSPRQTADDWRRQLGLVGDAPAMRGIASKKGQEHIDDAIERLVTSPNATIEMPLWGFSLDPQVALGYGSRFVFRLTGTFSAVPAWRHSSERFDELEMIGSGSYRVVEVQREGDSLFVDLEQIETISEIPVSVGGRAANAITEIPPIDDQGEN